jgi:hypothetical protein
MRGVVCHSSNNNDECPSVKKETANRLHRYKVFVLLKKSRDERAETHTSFDMSRKSKAKDQTKALNIPFTLTQVDLVQKALAVAKEQTQALNIPVKVPGQGLFQSRD